MVHPLNTYHPDHPRNRTLPTLSSREQSTEASYGGAIAMFDEFQTLHDNPTFDQLMYTDFEGEESIQYKLSTFGCWVLKAAPEKSNGDKYKASSLEKYFGRVATALKEKLPKHPDFVNQDSWYPDLLESFKNGALRRELQGAGDTSDTTTIPVYKKNKECRGGGNASQQEVWAAGSE